METQTFIRVKAQPKTIVKIIFNNGKGGVYVQRIGSYRTWYRLDDLERVK
jgi:hypothetical protein